MLTTSDATAANLASPLLEPGRNCWRVERAARAAPIVDAADYFRAFKAAALKARRQIVMTGWDMDSRIQLEADPAPSGVPNVFGKFLNYLVATRPRLRVHVLEWDFPFVMGMEREALPVFSQAWKWHPHLRFQLDASFPLGGCHHQKLVVIDDALAFCGGMDFSRGRRDTPEHADDDPRRVDFNGHRYGPKHDVQMMFDGPAAAAIGVLARERWRRATGKRLRPPPRSGLCDPWPEGFEPTFRDVALGVARTEPTWRERPGVKENEALWLDAMRAARRHVYIENQYLAADSVVEAMKARLQERDGPEFVVVVPLNCLAFFERTVMGAALARHMETLQQADRYGRLRILAPVTAKEAQIQIHSKVLVVDDRLLRVGSANLNNRSMGLDTECDVAFETAGRDDLKAGVLAFRDRLLAEHLDAPPEAVTAAVRETGSLVAAVDRLNRSEGRGLRPVDVTHVPIIGDLIDSPLLDPSAPIDAEALSREFLPPGSEKERGRGRLIATFAAVFAIVALIALWSLTPLKDLADPDAAIAWADELGAVPFAPAVAILAFLALGFVFFPVTALIAATSFALGPFVGIPTAMVGALTSAATMFWIGRLAGRPLVGRFAGRTLDKVIRRVAKQGVVAVATIRVIPIAPFSAVNLVVGASRIRFSDFMIGSLIGLTPAVIAYSILGDLFGEALREPTPTRVALLAAVWIGVLSVGWVVGRLVARRRAKKSM